MDMNFVFGKCELYYYTHLRALKKYERIWGKKKLFLYVHGATCMLGAQFSVYLSHNLSFLTTCGFSSTNIHNKYRRSSGS